MITIQLHQAKQPKGSATSGKPVADFAAAEWDGHLFSASSAHGASMALERKLVAAGCDDQPWQAIGPGGQRRLYGGSLHRLAKLTVAEGKAGVRFARFVERPDFVLGASQNGFEAIQEA